MRRITLSISDETWENIHRVADHFDITQSELLEVVFNEDFKITGDHQRRVDAIKIKKFNKRKTASGTLRALKGMSPEQIAELLGDK